MHLLGNNYTLYINLYAHSSPSVHDTGFNKGCADMHNLAHSLHDHPEARGRARSPATNIERVVLF